MVAKESSLLESASGVYVTMGLSPENRTSVERYGYSNDYQIDTVEVSAGKCSGEQLLR